MQQKTNTQLHDILKKRIDSTVRLFNLAYLKHLRTGQQFGHLGHATTLSIYLNLYNDMFGQTYDLAQFLINLKVECSAVIDAEHKQEVFDF